MWSSCGFTYCACLNVMRFPYTVYVSVLELTVKKSQAKPSLAEASVLCKVLAATRSVFYETGSRFSNLMFLCHSDVTYMLNTGVCVTETENFPL